MKVCTDACLFGAWIAGKLASLQLHASAILDIGTGTGLLSLMMAQRSTANIDAVEIDSAAAAEAAKNVEASPWSDRISIIHHDVRQLKAVHRYDLIVSNPPFYQNDLHARCASRNLALHSHALTFEELLKGVVELLKGHGYFAVLLPFTHAEMFSKAAAGHGLYLNERCLVKQTENHNYFRTMALFSFGKAEIKTTAVSIKASGEYSPEFKAILTGYYLML